MEDLEVEFNYLNLFKLAYFLIDLKTLKNYLKLYFLMKKILVFSILIKSIFNYLSVMIFNNLHLFMYLKIDIYFIYFIIKLILKTVCI
jgi:hypothetical protein